MLVESSSHITQIVVKLVIQFIKKNNLRQLETLNFSFQSSNKVCSQLLI